MKNRGMQCILQSPRNGADSREQESRGGRKCWSELQSYSGRKH